jgi:hypothetical protein
MSFYTTAITLIMIGEYVGRVIECTNLTPQYVVREVIKGNDKDE